jgi:hypothetical protein
MFIGKPPGTQAHGTLYSNIVFCFSALMPLRETKRSGRSRVGATSRKRESSNNLSANEFDGIQPMTNRQIQSLVYFAKNNR